MNVTFPYLVTQEYLRLQCFYNGVNIFNDFYATIQIKSEVEKRCNSKIIEPDKDRVNVIVLTIDSLSRLNFHRQMPQSSRWILEKMHGVEMMGYTKLADNTFPILTAMLMGLSSDDIESHCSGTSYDYCPFVWKDFSKRGYRTAFGEDSYIISSFNFERKGFRQTPTDYYLRPLFSAEYKSMNRTPWNPHDYICFANRIQPPVLLNWTRDFIAVMKDKSHFGYFHSSGLSHDDVNWAQLLDPYIYDVLRSSFDSGYFNNTMFILMSDHGMRFGPIRETYKGRLEDSLPLLIVTFPEWFRQKYPHVMRSLRINSKRLVSAFDIHQTFLDVLDSKFDVRAPISLESQLPKAISLFEEVPMQRTCVDASIPIHMCACQAVEEGHIDSEDATMSAMALVAELNSRTEAKREKCSILTLASVLRVEIAKPVHRFGKTDFKHSIRDVTVVVLTTPGDAKFEGTVRLTNNVVTGVLGISRVNRYGNQSICVANMAELKKYCFCLNS